MDIKIKKTTSPKTKPDENNLSFGKYFTDHMFVMDYLEDKGWHNAEISEYASISMDPATLVFHYGQEVFEGMKAYKKDDGKILMFRPDMNAKRINESSKRLCMPEIPEEMFIEAIKALIKTDKDWVPSVKNSSLYIRPFIIGTESAVGMKSSSAYKFIIITSPVGSYYLDGLTPMKIYVEEEYVRAVKGGTGTAKCGGNYGASLIAQEKAEKLGYNQVLWLDGVERKYVEEVGTMNVMFKIDGDIYTPSLDGSILPGITRNSSIQLLKDFGYKVKEEKLAIDFILEAYKSGKLEEAFGTGTAAVISPIGEMNYKGNTVLINDFKLGQVTEKLFNELTGIQKGEIEDKYNWTVEVY